MGPDDPNVPLTDLFDAGVRLRPVEAATLVRELIQQVIRGELPGMPSAHVIRLSQAGRVLVEGPVAAGDRGVARAGQLLDALLPPFDAPQELRVPGALRLLAARASGTLDLPPFASLESLATALTRFAADDAPSLLRELIAAWSQSSALQVPVEARGGPDPAGTVGDGVPATVAPLRIGPARDDARTALTVSDVRRARRATGLTLAEVAERSRIPSWLLRELEWGYLRNWPSGQYGRTQLVRYARASGLDDDVVVRAVWPLLDARPEGAHAIVPAMEDDGLAVTVDPSPAWVDAEPIETSDMPLVHSAALPDAWDGARLPPPRSRRRLAAALAIPALLAIGLLPAVLDRWGADGPAVTEVAETLDRGSLSGPADAPGTAAPPAVAAAPARPRADSGRTDERVEPARAAPLSDARLAEGRPSATTYSPAFASTGSAMFYHVGSKGESALMRADTSSEGTILRVTRVVDDAASNFHARPSPDGERIAFDSDRDGERAVFVAASDGSNVRRVSGPGFAAIPSWSPDGRRLAYVRAEPDRPRVWNLWVADLDSGEERRITSHRAGQPWGGSWFPDGRRMAYSHETRLIVRDLDTGRERAYPSPVKGRLVRTPAVSPDGQRIVFQVHRDGTWLLQVADGSMRKILTDPSAEEFAWAPDGARVAYHSRRSGQWGVWVMIAR